MAKEKNEKVPKRNVFCNNCQREYSSKVKNPVCRQCWSTNVVEASSISGKMALKIMEREINERLDKIDEVVYDLHITMDHIKKRLDKQWEDIKKVDARFDAQRVHIAWIYKHLGFDMTTDTNVVKS